MVAGQVLIVFRGAGIVMILPPVRLRLNFFPPDSNCYFSITHLRPRAPADMGHMQHDRGGEEMVDHWPCKHRLGSRRGPGPLTIAQPTDSSQHSRKLGSGSWLENWDFHEIRTFLETPIKSGFYDNYRFTTQLIQTLTPWPNNTGVSAPSEFHFNDPWWIVQLKVSC